MKEFFDFDPYVSLFWEGWSKLLCVLGLLCVDLDPGPEIFSCILTPS